MPRTLFFLVAEVEIDHSKERCSYDQQEGYGIDNGRAAVPDLKIQVDGKRRFRAHEKEGRVEVFK